MPTKSKPKPKPRRTRKPAEPVDHILDIAKQLGSAINTSNLYRAMSPDRWPGGRETHFQRQFEAMKKVERLVAEIIAAKPIGPDGAVIQTIVAVHQLGHAFKGRPMLYDLPVVLNRVAQAWACLQAAAPWLITSTGFPSGYRDWLGQMMLGDVP